MVFMKKGATPAKNQQLKKGKKATPVQQEESDDLDFDDEMDDSDEDITCDTPQLQRTPANKGSKARQSLSEKKVSFSIPGKNSPAVKTPKKDNSMLSKKQSTPASKGKMQEFKGMKKNQVKQEEEDDDEDDDDDIDEDDEDMDDDLDLELDEGDEDDKEGGDDDDDDDDDEDDDDDDDEDDDEDDEDDDEESGKNNVQKKLSLLKQQKNNIEQNKQKTPVKGNDKAKNAVTPKSEVKKEKASPKTVKDPQIYMEEEERRKLRNAMSLFVGNLPKDATVEELKALSADIVDVTIPRGNRGHIQTTKTFAFLVFNSEAKAEANYTSLQNKKFRGQPLTLDFVGLKSKNKKPVEEKSVYNLKKLFVTGIPLKATIAQVASYFPEAYQISFNQSPLFRSATINFMTEEAAKSAFESNKEIEIGSHKLVVLHSKVGKASHKKHKRSRGKKSGDGGSAPKKMKFSKKPSSGNEE